MGEANLRELYDKAEFQRDGRYRQAIDIALGVAANLERRHLDCSVYRDLNPRNIRLTENGDVEILDSGLSAFAQLRKLDWWLGGDIAYAPMEVYYPKRGEMIIELSNSVDIASWSAVMVEFLTGEYPFRMEKGFQDITTWRTIEKCCRFEVRTDAIVAVPTSNPRVKESLLKKMNEAMACELLPWPRKFWELARDSDGRIRPGLASAGVVVDRLRELSQRPWTEDVFPWPPELCLLIAECSLGIVEPGDNCVTRPSAEAIQEPLRDMLGREWIDCRLPWVGQVTQAPLLLRLGI